MQLEPRFSREYLLDELSIILAGRLSDFYSFKDNLDEWELFPVLICGDLAGIVMISGAEIHVASLQTHRGRFITKGNLKKFLGGILKKHGHVLTSVMRENKEGQIFVKRLGFKPINVKENLIEYEKTLP